MLPVDDRPLGSPGGGRAVPPGGRVVVVPIPPPRAATVRAPVLTAVVTAAAVAVASGRCVGVILPAAIALVAVLAAWAVEALIGAPATARREGRRFDDDLEAARASVLAHHRLERLELETLFPGSRTTARSVRDDATAGHPGDDDPEGRRRRYLVLGRGAVESRLRLSRGAAPTRRRADAGAGPDDDRVLALARLEQDAATLADGPLCIEARGVVGVVGPGVLARAAADGFRLQARMLGAGELTVRDGRTRADAGRVDTLIEIADDGTAVVVLRAGAACRTPIELDYVSCREGD